MSKVQRIKIMPHKQRSWIIPSAHMRLGGPMRDKRLKRSEENKNEDHLKEWDDAALPVDEKEKASGE